MIAGATKKNTYLQFAPDSAASLYNSSDKAIGCMRVLPMIARLGVDVDGGNGGPLRQLAGAVANLIERGPRGEMGPGGWGAYHCRDVCHSHQRRPGETSYRLTNASWGTMTPARSPGQSRAQLQALNESHAHRGCIESGPAHASYRTRGVGMCLMDGQTMRR